MREAPVIKNLSGAGGRKSQGALARLCEFSLPKATIEIPVRLERISVCIPAGCALRWAQKDEGEIQLSPYIPLDSHTPLRNAGEV